MLSALLAMVMVFALTCTPAFAAKADTLADINTDDSIWVGVKNVDDLKTTVDISLRYWSKNGNTVAKDKDATDFSDVTVYELPLGVTIAAGPNNGFVTTPRYTPIRMAMGSMTSGSKRRT